MPSDNQARIDDTIHYLTHHDLDPGGLTATIARRIPADRLGPLISIGGMRGPKALQNEAHTQQRRALRALLLTSLTRGHMPGDEAARLREDFFADPEARLKSQIRWLLAHANTTDEQARRNAAQIAIRAATAGTFRTGNQCPFEGWSFDPLRVDAGCDLNCFGAVLFWLFQGGAFSHRWLRPLLAPHGQPAVDAAVTGGARPGGMPQMADGAGVEAGRVILLYSGLFPLAHVIIADGQGGFVSNNTPLGHVAPRDLLDLIDGRGGPLAGVDPAALQAARPVRLSFAQLQCLIPIHPPGGYLGYAILGAGLAPWEGRPVWNR